MLKTIVYTPKTLRSMAEICREMGVGKKRVKQWKAMGAPIAIEGDGRHKIYSADHARLQMWREETFDKLDDSFDPNDDND